jgi:hypothetical protein
MKRNLILFIFYRAQCIYIYHRKILIYLKLISSYICESDHALFLDSTYQIITVANPVE